MAPSLFVSLFFALSVHAWPQHPFEPEELGGSMTLPVIPYSPVSARSLPVVDDGKWMGTLPVPHMGRRGPVGDVLVDRGLDERRDASAVNNIGRAFPVEEAASGTLTLPVIHAAKPGLLKRAAVEVQLENRSDVAYYAQLNIGTPPQTVFAQLDTGSFELWVNPDCSQLPNVDAKFCLAVGEYNPSRSSTSDVTDQTASLRYGIGAANVTYVHDDISLTGSAAMKGVQFGVATESQDQFAGILGIGHGLGINTRYKNFMDELKAQGVTKTKTFSLALGSKDEQEGVIIFGGIDTAKFEGELAPLPIIPAEESPDGVARYWVSLKSISHTEPGGSPKPWSNTEMPVFLDSGATLTLLPQNIVRSIAASLGATEMDASGFYIVDCGLVDQNGSINFDFDGVTIKVPYKEMIREIKTLPTMCYLGMMPSQDFTLLGDTFLRSAYVVFDQDTNMTYMAPYTNCGSQPKTINLSSDLDGVTGSCGNSNNVAPSTPDVPASETATTVTKATPTADTSTDTAPDVSSISSLPVDATTVSTQGPTTDATTIAQATGSATADVPANGDGVADVKSGSDSSTDKEGVASRQMEIKFSMGAAVVGVVMGLSGLGVL